MELPRGTAELMDPATWAPCARGGGGTQPCLCWFAKQQDEIADDHWPGGEDGKFHDWLSLCRQHICNAPFDGTGV